MTGALRPPEGRAPADSAGSPGASTRSGGAVVWAVVVGAFAALALAGPLKMILRSGDDGPSAVGTVKMAGLRFSPGTLTVPAGTEVVFDNNDVAPHTVTAEDGSLDSGILKPGAVFRLTLNQRLAYFCAVHPDMTATVEIAG
ncbi:MAG: cupredoxin domain-containing protein [Acidimicrobiales bacterium]